jgi:hypothetical protein
MKEQKIEKSNFNCQKQLFAEKLKLGDWGRVPSPALRVTTIKIKKN